LGRTIVLGSTSDGGPALELSDAELDTIAAGALRIGNNVAGDIVLLSPIDPANVATLDLQTGGAIGNGPHAHHRLGRE
jgi:hypothetical protein